MKWSVHIDGGPRRVNHAAVCIGDKIYSFGGYCSTEEYKDWEPIPVHVLCTYSLRWSVVDFKKENVVPFQRYGHTTVAYGNKVFMWGGRNNAISCEKLTCFDLDTLEWSYPEVSGSVPYAKDGHSACVIKNRMYIFGGFEYHTDQYSQEVNYLDLDTLQWKYVQATGEAPSHRDFHTAVAYGDRMYVFGGRGDMYNSFSNGDEIYCPQLYYLDTTKEKWNVVTTVGDGPPGRRSHSAWIYKDDMYIFGGYNGRTKLHFNDVFKYSMKDNTWSELTIPGKVPCKRRRQACIVHRTKMYLFGGTSPCEHKCVKHEEWLHRVSEKLIDNNDLHILDYEPSLKMLSIDTVLSNDLDQSELPEDIFTRVFRQLCPLMGSVQLYQVARWRVPMNFGIYIIILNKAKADVQEKFHNLSGIARLALLQHKELYNLVFKRAIRIVTVPNSISRPLSKTG